MKKQKVKKAIFRKEFYNSYVTWKDLKHINFQDDDTLLVEWIQEQGSGEYEQGGYFYVHIERMVEETDEECEKRRAEFEKDQTKRRQDRYDTKKNLI